MGISGAPGSGKTTLAACMVDLVSTFLDDTGIEIKPMHERTFWGEYSCHVTNGDTGLVAF